MAVLRTEKRCFSYVAGFTVLELLVALTLLSMITLVILGTLRIGARVWERTTEEQGIVEETMLAHKFIRRWIEQAYPLIDRSDPLRPVIVFQGTGDRLDLVAPVPKGILEGGLARYSIFVQPVEGERHLVVSSRHERADQNAPPHPSSILLEDVSGFSLSYFGAQHSGEPDGWHDRWVDASSLPKLVRVSIKFRAGDNVELEVAPKIRMAAECEFPPTQSCGGS